PAQPRADFSRRRGHPDADPVPRRQSPRPVLEGPLPARRSAARAAEERAERSTGLSMEPADDVAIRVRDLRFRYPGATRDALAGLSLYVCRGEFLGITGPSGTSKSTMWLCQKGMIPAAEFSASAVDTTQTAAARQ